MKLPGAVALALRLHSGRADDLVVAVAQGLARQLVGRGGTGTARERLVGRLASLPLGTL